MNNVERQQRPARAQSNPLLSPILKWTLALPVAALIATLLLAPTPARGQPAAQSLVLPATASEIARYARTVRHPDVGVVRQRPVRVDVSALDDRDRAADALTVELFDGQTVTLSRDRIERRGDRNYTWHGKLPGRAAGFALITVVDGQVSGTIELGDTGRGARTRYRVQSTSDGLTLLQEIDPSGFPADHPAGAEPLAPAADSHAGADARSLASGSGTTAAASADTAATIDVVIVFSNQSAAAAGASMGAQAQQAVDTANLVYANSGIALRLRLVYAGPANYVESGDFNTDLSRLTSGADGYMDSVSALRETYGADLVSLFVENGAYCGMGWIGPNAGYGFTVVNRGCASGNLSFPHEIGHNFGARHDAYVDAATTPYAYGHGYVNASGGWRDVMAYNNACAAVGISCTRIAYLSNPNVSYGNPASPTGNATTADTARVHNQNALTVANFRASKSATSPACTWSLSPASASAGSTAGAGSVSINTQTGCVWNVASNASWLTAGAGTSGSGTLSYSYAGNTGPARSATLTIGSATFTLSQASGCAYALGTTSASVAATGASGSTALSTASGCTWTASSSASWLTLTTAASGAGSATVGYSVAANTGAARSANITVGGRTLLV
ncbi:MAG TPA: M12 family metallo-peptidase, partial [Casimicrobiaceae bacterium]|nr:M12 family metallo-peptidase [Casimicrobiaceae bacterium]